MYTKYFGFYEKPFTLTPNPRFIFLSKNHKEAFAHLLYGINNHYGFIELTGEVGTGKTTVLRTLLGQLQEDSYRTAFIFSPCLTGIELLRNINTEFGIDSKSEYANELLAELNHFLLAETATGRTVVLVIDESQNLDPDVLEQIRLISNLETESDKLIQIVLSGQPELEELLGRPGLRQLNQRIAVRYQLRSLGLSETRSYIRQRMEVAGDTGGVDFSRFAIIWTYLCSRGVPRMINILCDRALLIAYGNEKRRITTVIIIQAKCELLNRFQVRRKFLMVSGIIVTLASLSIITMNRLPINFTDQNPRLVSEAQTSPILETQHQSTKSENIRTLNPLNRFKQEILSFDQNDTHILAFNAIAEKWGVRPITILNERFVMPGMFRLIAAKRNLKITYFKGSLDKILRYNLPFIISTKITGEFGEYCYAVTSLKNGNLTISPTLFDRETISKNDLESISNGTFYLVWQNYGQIPSNISIGEKRFEIKALQRLLKQAGYYHDKIDGFYSTATAAAIKAYQNSMGIDANKSLGELTLATLTRFNTDHKVPSLQGN